MCVIKRKTLLMTGCGICIYVPVRCPHAFTQFLHGQCFSWDQMCVCVGGWVGCVWVCGCVCVCVCVGGELLEVRRSHNSLGLRDPKRIVRAQKLSLGTRHDANVEQVPKESQLHSHYTFTSVNMIISSNIHAVLVDQNSSIEARYCFLSCQFLLTHLF